MPRKKITFAVYSLCLLTIGRGHGEAKLYVVMIMMNTEFFWKSGL
jgi:hypothetical protein